MQKNKYINRWQPYLDKEMAKPYFLPLQKKLQEEYATQTVYPPPNLLFRALDLTPINQIKVVLVGQDPYFNENQAMGLAFSVNREAKVPPSLKNIYKERENDLGIAPASHGDLTAWAERGVLLLNTTLSVRKGEPMSHKGLGWEEFTDEIIKIVSNERENVVFWLWGNFAKGKRGLIDESKHKIIETSHPSPLSARHSFFGSRVFSQTNNFLKSKGLEEVDFRN